LVLGAGFGGAREKRLGSEEDRRGRVRRIDGFRFDRIRAGSCGAGRSIERLICALLLDACMNTPTTRVHATRMALTPAWVSLESGTPSSNSITKLVEPSCNSPKSEMSTMCGLPIDDAARFLKRGIWKPLSAGFSSRADRHRPRRPCRHLPEAPTAQLSVPSPPPRLRPRPVSRSRSLQRRHLWLWLLRARAPVSVARPPPA
jgi:hypothetical protein